MIMAYVKMAFAAAMMLVQPIQHGYDRGQVGDGVAVASSRDVSSRPVQPASAQSSPKEVAQRVTATRGERSKPAAHAIIAKQVASNSRAMQRTKLANLQPAGNAAAGSDTKRAKIVDSHPTDNAAANSNARTIQEQVMAAKGLAERLTAAAMVQASEPKANNTGSSDHSTARINAEKTAAVSPNNTDHLVAILMARPEIKSVSDLAGKSIAIDNRQSASNGNVRTAIAAAGAAEVQLSEGQTTAINRVASGEVPAAVLTLVSPEAAEAFPDIAGFRIFRIPISPRSLKVRLDTR
jgi:hypothetical protein